MQMQAKPKVGDQAKCYVEAECPAGKDLLRLRFDLDARQYARVTLRFMPSGWSWTEDMGMIPAGLQTAEVELTGMPGGSFVLMASFYSADEKPYTGKAILVASDGVRGAIDKMPYLCS